MSRRLKIGFVLDDGMDRLDGVQQYVFTLGEWLKSQGHEVHYLAGQTKRVDIDNLHVMSKNLRVRFNANSLSTPLPASKEKIKKLLHHQNFDILHVQVPYSPFMAARVIAAAPAETKVVGTFHILPYGYLQKQAALLLGIWLRRNAQRFEIMLAVSPPAVDFCGNTFGVRATVLPNPVDISKYINSPKKTSNKSILRIVFLGRLVERKGCLQLIRAISYMESRKLTSQSYTLEIGGDGPDKNSIESLIGKYNLGDTVRLVGFINEAAKPGFLASSDIAVFPSLGGESFGIVLLEAMAAGAGAVVGGDNVGYRSVLGSIPKSLVDCSDHILLAEKIAELINNKSLRTRIHTDQQKLVKSYDVNIVGSKLLKIYQSLVK